MHFNGKATKEPYKRIFGSIKRFSPETYGILKYKGNVTVTSASHGIIKAGLEGSEKELKQNASLLGSSIIRLKGVLSKPEFDELAKEVKTLNKAIEKNPAEVISWLRKRYAKGI